MRPRRIAPLLLACALAGAIPGAAASAADLTLRYTASLNGTIEGCDCKLSPRAGLVKVAAWLRAEHRPGTDLLLDAGDVLDGSSDELLARAILDTYAELGYGAVAVGEQELGLGATALLEYRSRYPLISHNLSLRDASGSWKAFTPEPVILRAAGRSVAVIALLDPAVLESATSAVASAARLASPRDTALRLLADSRVKAADFVVLLYHGSHDRAVELLRGVDGFDVAVVAHEQKLIRASRVGNTIVASPDGAGNHVGSLALTRWPRVGVGFVEEIRSFDARFGPDDAATKKRADAYDEELRSRLKASGSQGAKG
jgi:2',3'-cyclic-nucleotide 2'-phosphodiesterase (5'-nucleotidase family)